MDVAFEALGNESVAAAMSWRGLFTARHSDETTPAGGAPFEAVHDALVGRYGPRSASELYGEGLKYCVGTNARGERIIAPEVPYGFIYTIIEAAERLGATPATVETLSNRLRADHLFYCLIPRDVFVNDVATCVMRCGLFDPVGCCSAKCKYKSLYDHVVAPFIHSSNLKYNRKNSFKLRIPIVIYRLHKRSPFCNLSRMKTDRALLLRRNNFARQRPDEVTLDDCLVRPAPSLQTQLRAAVVGGMSYVVDPPEECFEPALRQAQLFSYVSSTVPRDLPFAPSLDASQGPSLDAPFDDSSDDSFDVSSEDSATLEDLDRMDWRTIFQASCEV